MSRREGHGRVVRAASGVWAASSATLLAACGAYGRALANGKATRGAGTVCKKMRQIEKNIDGLRKYNDGLGNKSLKLCRYML